MKIGIEAQRIFRKKKHGMDIVALQLIRNLQQIDTDNEYFIFVKADEDSGILHSTERFKIVVLPSAPYPYWEQVLLPRKAEELGVELLHCTSNTAPIKTHIPLVVTVHDIIYLERLNLTKGSLYQIAGNLYRRWNVPLVVRKSTRVITVSEFERARIEHFFNLPHNHIRTIYNGVSEHFIPVTDMKVRERARALYNLPEKFMFYLGNTDPKKNMIGVMKAMSLLRKEGQLTVPLVMLDIDQEFLHSLARQIGDTEILSMISFCGYVPNEDLPAIYSMCEIFLYPSLRESFGIPILEAMACGAPVITSNTSSMPEVAGDAAVFIDPTKPEDLASKIKMVSENENLRENLRTKGRHRYADFSWKKNAMQTLALYQELSKQRAV